VKRKTLVALLVTAAVLIGAAVLLTGLGNVQHDRETELVRDAVKNAALSCYAAEGAFPVSVDYLCTHYGLAYDKDRYIVAYDAFASNVLPEIRVLEKGVNEG